jgi:hypothetical protein
MRVTHPAVAPGALRAEGEIDDPAGAPLAHRTVSSAEGRECAAMARAIGVWAALVLDAEALREKKESPEVETTSAHTDTVIWPPPTVNEQPPPEFDLFLKHEKAHRTIELGLGGFFLAGNDTHGMAGGSLFGIFEVSSGWYLRPAILLGQSTHAVTPQPESTLAATRFDACGRLPGYYHERRGIQLDLCGGADVGFLNSDGVSAPGTNTQGSMQTQPIFALGPSFGLHGELGEFAAEVRALTEWNVTGAFMARGEVGLTWRLR